MSCHDTFCSHTANKKLVNTCKVVTPFNHKASGACSAVLSRLAQEECPTSNLPLWLVDWLQARLTVHTIPVYGPLILNTHY